MDRFIAIYGLPFPISMVTDGDFGVAVLSKDFILRKEIIFKLMRTFTLII